MHVSVCVHVPGKAVCVCMHVCMRVLHVISTLQTLEASSTTPHGATNTLRYISAYAAERMHYTANTTDVFVARPLTSSVVGTIPQNELYGGHTANVRGCVE